jgi:DNA-binding transcriptional ArsR family regulator
MAHAVAETRAGDAARIALFKALSHPLRYELLMYLGDQVGTPKEMADELSANFKQVCEQVKILHDGGHIELVGEDNRRGGTQHLYKASVRPMLSIDEWDELPQLARELISETILRRAADDLRASAASGLFDNRPRRSLLRIPLRLDEQGFEDADEENLRHLARMEEVQVESAERRRHSKEAAINTVSLTVLAEVPPGHIRN